MTENVSGPAPAARKPGVVILAAVLNFLAASTAGAVFFFSLTAFLFTGAFHFADFVASQMAQMTPNMTYGVNFVLVLLLTFSFVFMAYFAAIAVGLLKGWKWAWYGQLVLSVMGLVGFPVGTILNGVVIFLLFRRDARDYFGV